MRPRIEVVVEEREPDDIVEINQEREQDAQKKQFLESFHALSTIRVKRFFIE
jgi:hypothetical protein